MLPRAISEHRKPPCYGVTKYAFGVVKFGLTYKVQIPKLLNVNYLPDDILTKVDRTSMFYSLEVRSPFMDHQLRQRALSMPSTANLREGHGKHLLHKLCMKLFPSDLFKTYRRQGAVPLRVVSGRS